MSCPTYAPQALRSLPPAQFYTSCRHNRTRISTPSSVTDILSRCRLPSLPLLAYESSPGPESLPLATSAGSLSQTRPHRRETLGSTRTRSTAHWRWLTRLKSALADRRARLVSCGCLGTRPACQHRPTVAQNVVLCSQRGWHCATTPRLGRLAVGQKTRGASCTPPARCEIR